MKLYLYLSLFFLTPSLVLANQVTFLSDNWCPYTCEPESSKPGILVEVVDTIFAGTEYKADVKLVNWARAIKAVRAGKADALLGAYVGDAPDFVFHKTPVMYSQMCFFIAQSDDWIYQGYPSLNERSLSVVNGYSYGESFDDFIATHPENIVNLAGNELIERHSLMLAKKRINTIVEDRNVFQPQLASGLFKSAGCLAEEGMYIAFSPADLARSQSLIETLDLGINKLKSEGRIEQIIKKYYQN